MPEIAATFESVTEFKAGGRPPVTQLERLWRSAREVETYQVGSKDGQLWKMDVAGEISYCRLLHPERIEVEFLVGDLKANASQPDWGRVCCIVSPALLHEVLKAGANEKFGETDVQRFTGEIGGQKWTVLWSEADQIAVQVRVEDERAARTVTMKERHPLNESPWQRMRREEYQNIEFTELGDHDTDKRYVRIMKRIGMSCGHRNCGATCVLPNALP
jgi:hypothetical protein